MTNVIKPKLVIPKKDSLDQLDIGKSGVCRIGFPFYNGNRVVDMIKDLWVGKSVNLENTLGFARKEVILERTPGLEYVHLESKLVSGSISPERFYKILIEEFYNNAIELAKSKNERYFGLDIHPKRRTGKVTAMCLTPVVSLFFDPRGAAIADYEDENERAAAKAVQTRLQPRIGCAREF